MSTELMTTRDVAKLLHLSVRTVYALILRGQLQGFRVGRGWRFSQQHIDDLLMRHR